MKGRPPSQLDVERMKKALSLVVAYDMGTKENEFQDYKELVREEDDQEKLVEALAMFSWMLVRSFEETGVADRETVLQWYGMKFAESAEKMRE